MSLFLLLLCQKMLDQILNSIQKIQWERCQDVPVPRPLEPNKEDKL